MMPDQNIRRPLYAVVSEKIITMIKSGELPDGARLPAERVLAEQMGVSRTSVREAIRLLSLSGMLTSQQGSGTFVNASAPGLAGDELRFMSDAYYEQDYMNEFRKYIECNIIEIAAYKATKEDINELKSIVYDQYKSRCEHKNEIFYIKEFHLALAKATHNPIFVSLMRIINSLFDQRRSDSVTHHMKRRSESIYWHNKIIEALESRDIQKCREAMEQHMRSNANVMQEE